MSWGKAISITFIVFAGFIGTMVYWMSREKIDLVREDYYEDELTYQRQIQRVVNASRLDSSAFVQYQPEKQQIRLNLPNGLVSGTLLLYCPANREQDVRRLLTKATPKVSTVPMQGRPSGLWRAQLNWSDGQREFYIERELILP